MLSCPEDVGGMPPTAGSTRAQLPLPSLTLLSFLSNGLADTSCLTDTLYFPRRNVSLIASRPSATNWFFSCMSKESLRSDLFVALCSLTPPPTHSLLSEITRILVDQVLEISAML